MKRLKILIVYETKTGNTELVANSMKEGLSGETVNLIQAKNLDSSSLKSYDIVFLGSGIYGGAVGKTIKKLMRKVTELPSKFVLFWTHESEDLVNAKDHFKGIYEKIIENDCIILDEFECFGENKSISEERKLEMLQNLPQDRRKEVEEILKKLKGHPNADDLENAKLFAKLCINKF